MIANLFNKYRLIYSIFVLSVFALLFVANWSTVETAQEAIDQLENFDIRTDHESKKELSEFLQQTDAAAGKRIKSASEEAQKLLGDSDPQIKIERGAELGMPEVIESLGSLLSSRSDRSKVSLLRQFIVRNNSLFGIEKDDADALEVAADYSNPENKLSFVHLQQKINSVPVFQGEIKAGFTVNGEMIRVINNLAPGTPQVSPSAEFGSAADAVVNVSKFAGLSVQPASLKQRSGTEFVFEFDDTEARSPITAEKFYFPVRAGEMRPAWRILYWTRDAAYYVLSDAATGKLLWRKNISENQTLPATYNVYGNTSAFIKSADSPAPCSPGCSDPNNCPQPPAISRTDFTLIGNEAPYEFNDLGWIPDNGLPVRTPADPNITDGNNCEAGIDRDGTNGVDPMGHAVGNPFRVFSYTYNPAPGNPPPPDDPLPPNPQPYPPTQFQQGVIANGFHLVNRWHDELYRLGFTEQAGNFQHFNFGRGGAEGDRISFEMQDGSGTNGANFSTPADGGRPRMQMYIWTPGTPARDGALDATIVLHEITHGLTSRLHGNSTGLNTNMARGMSEGWSDFYANALLSEPGDAPCGTYAVGSYIAFELVPANHYYGIRRYPTTRIGCTGPNGLPHNPLTFGHLNTGNCSNIPSAFPRGPLGSTICDQIHNAGEIWSQALWEVRGFLIEQHGGAEGNRRALQYITDGMKFSPINPTMLQARDAIIAAASASIPADVQFIWRGFAARGMGFSASIISTSPANVVEAFDTPNVAIGTGFSVSDAPGNGDGYFEPGERIAVTIPVTNRTGSTITGVAVRLTGGPSAFYGDIPAGQTIIRTIEHTIPVNAPCPGNFALEFTITGSAGTRIETRSIFLGIPVGGPPAVFSSTGTIDLPGGQPNTSTGPASPYPSTINVSGLSGNKRIKLELTSISHSFPSDLDFLLVSPTGAKYVFLSDSGGNSAISNLTFTLSDGASVVPPTTGWAAGDFLPYNLGAGDPFVSPAPSAPYSEAAPAGSATFMSAFGQSGSEMNGAWRLFAVDDANTDSGSMAGWKLTFESSEYTCILCRACPGTGTRADFDGDGKADLSVYRPSDGIWYVNGSTAGFSAVRWGIGSDQPLSGDFDGDGKTDYAVFRPSSDPNESDFYILNSNGFTFTGFAWGTTGDVPAVADYDGDGRADVSVFRPSNHTFYVARTTEGFLSFANIGSGTPQPGDYDGDGKADFATYSINGWFLAPSNLNYSSVNFIRWGAPGDVPMVEDYDGDGRDDYAVYRPSNGTWYIRGSVGTNIIVQFGIDSDIAAAADFDGDGKADIAVYRGGTWYLLGSSAGVRIEQFGLTGDKPIPAQR